MAQSQNIAREAIKTQITPILQGITEMLSSLQMDNQNIKNTLHVQQNQIHDIRNIATTQNDPSDIPQRPDQGRTLVGANGACPITIDEIGHFAPSPIWGWWGEKLCRRRRRR